MKKTVTTFNARWAAGMLLAGWTGLAHAQWVAYNDHYYGATTHTNASLINPYGAGTGASGRVGPLRNIASGANLPVTMEITNALISSGTVMAAPAVGTPSGNLFLPFINFGSGTVNHSITLLTNSVVSYVFTGLNPAKVYSFRGTAARGNLAYTNRWTLCTLQSADYQLDAHTTNVLTTARVPALAGNQAAFNSGVNHQAANGDYIGWDSIRPGADGTVTVRTELYTGTVPNGGNSAGGTAYSFSAVRLEETTVTPVAISSQPTNKTVAAGTPASFTVGVNGTPPIAFVWRKAGAPISGATNQTYTIPATSAGDAGNYSVVVANSANSVTSSVAVLTVLPPIGVTINQQPTNLTVNAGSPAAFSVSVSGSAPISYQWYRGVNPILNATNSSYSIANAAVGDAGDYHVVVSNSVNSATSLSAILTVNYSPVAITVQPVGATVNQGANYTFSVTASGSFPRYQWYRANSPIPNATNSTYSLTSIQAANGGLYTVVVANDISSQTSSNAILLVNIPPVTLVGMTNQTWRYLQPAADPGTAWKDRTYNDSAAPWASGRGIFAVEDAGNAVVFPLINTRLSLTNGTSRVLTYYFRTWFDFTNEASTVRVAFTNIFDDGAVVYINGNEAYRYNMPTGPVTYNTTASGAAPEGVFYITNIPPSMLVQGSNLVAVEVHQVNNTSSDVAMGLSVGLQFPPPTFLVVTNQPSSVSVEETQPFTLTFGVAGDGARYQWFRNGSPVPGANNASLVIASAATANSGTYYAVASNLINSVISTQVLVSVLVDTNPPQLLEADGTINRTNILLTFNERLNPTDANNIANYSITNTSGGILAITNVLLTNGNMVWVTAVAPRSSNANYIITVNNLRDLAPIPNTIPRDTRAPISFFITLVQMTTPATGATLWNYYSPVEGFDDPYPGDGWNNVGFPGAAFWGLGRAGFGNFPDSYEAPVPRNTALSLGNITDYFRNEFPFNASPLGLELRLRHVVDDGAIFYVNGREVARFNMPAGPAGSNTTAASTIGLPTTSAFIDITSAEVKVGPTVFAAELHQTGVADTRKFFAAELSAAVTSVTNGPVIITRNPTNVTVVENARANFYFMGVAATQFQWQRNGTNIAGATNPVLNLVQVPGSYHGSQIRVIAFNAHSRATSAPGILSVTLDTNGPALLAAYATGANQITLNFNELMDPVSAARTTNYVVTNILGGRLTVTAAAVASGTNIVLTLASRPAGSYVVCVNGAHDFAGNPLPPGSQVTVGFSGTVVAIDATTNWRYNTNNTDLGTGWIASNFDDSSWPQGPGLFEAKNGAIPPLPEPVRTVLPLRDSGGVNSIPTMYFRIKFVVEGDVTKATLSLRHIIDDGAVFYLNGQATPVYSVGMPLPATFATLASRTVGDAVYEGPFILPSGGLVPGTNVLAVEVHQSSLTSSDLTFAAQLGYSTPSVVLPQKDLTGTPPTIVTPPASQAACVGSVATFSVNAGGTAPLGYQWRLNGTAINGAILSNLTINPVQLANAGNYTVVVSNRSGMITSAVAVLTVNAPASIVSQPAGQAACSGSSATLSVVGGGTGPLTYQWRLNGNAVAGGTSSNLVLNPVVAGNYTVVIGNSCGSVTSAVAAVTVSAPPGIVTQPLSQSASTGAVVNFTVAANGTAPLSYQWRLNGANIGGATLPTLTINPVLNASAGNYTVVVGNSCGSVTSSIATLTIIPPPPPLKITRVPTGVSVSWTNNGFSYILQSSPRVGTSAVWLDIPGASNPYVVPSAAQTNATFYRLRK